MATVYISHDLSLLGSICDRIAIMYAGEIAESGMPEHIVETPLHPYTKALIDAVPTPEFNPAASKAITTIGGEPPNLIDLVEGCSFRQRCQVAEDVCRQEKPQLCEVSAGHFVSCHVMGGSFCRENMH